MVYKALNQAIFNVLCQVEYVPDDRLEQEGFDLEDVSMAKLWSTRSKKLATQLASLIIQDPT